MRRSPPVPRLSNDAWIILRILLPCPAATASDAFVGKVGTPCTGSTCTNTAVPYTYFSYLGGSASDVGLSIAVDTLQGARIAGWTNSPNFPTTPNNHVQPALSGAVDAFVSRIDTTASSTVSLGHYSTYLGGAGDDFGNQHRDRCAGQQLCCGRGRSGNFPTANPIQANPNGTSDAFVTKLGPTLNLALTETVTPAYGRSGQQRHFHLYHHQQRGLDDRRHLYRCVTVHRHFCLRR